MRTPMIRSSRFVVVLLATLLSLATLTKAGPPLICHSVEIGAAKSLPWISHDWNLSGGETYDTKNLVRDTLEILAPDTPVLTVVPVIAHHEITSGRNRRFERRAFAACQGIGTGAIFATAVVPA